MTTAGRGTVRFQVQTTIGTAHGDLAFRAYRDEITGFEHLAVFRGPLGDGALVRVHSECLTGEVFGSARCECGPQLDTALERIAAEGGVVVYLRGHEGRGIGLVAKLRAYALQDEGYDTVDANLALGFAADARDFGAAAAILADLGVRRVRLLTNNPDKERQLEEHGVAVDELVPLITGVARDNAGYLGTKRDRMGHVLPPDLGHSIGRP